MEEKFFFAYHLHQPMSECMALPVYERKWLLNRFVTQKNKEAEELERVKRKK